MTMMRRIIALALCALALMCNPAAAESSKHLGDSDPTGNIRLYYRVSDDGQLVITAMNDTDRTIDITYEVDAECRSLGSWKDFHWGPANISVNGGSDNSDFLQCHVDRDDEIRRVKVELIRLKPW